MAGSKVIRLKTRIVTARLGETRDWYCDVLGLFVVDEWDEPGDRGCILGLSGSPGEGLLEIREGQPGSDYGALSLQFRVDDVDAFAARGDCGVPSDGAADRPWGSRYLHLSDPNGIAIVVFSGSSL